MKIFALSLLMALVQGDRICTNPKGNDGESYTEGCLKMTCKAGTWRSSLDKSLCCYNKQPYLPNTTITATEDGCAIAIVYCKQEDDAATAVLQVENNCGEYSTEEQVQELKHLLVKDMEQTDCDKDSPVSTPTTSTTTSPTHATEGLVMSGGRFVFDSVEMFIPSTNNSCTLPSLPDTISRYGHTMSGLTICGGAACLQLSSGVWNVTHALQKKRRAHSSWQSDQKGMILMGGDCFGCARSSEVVGQGGKSFDMKHGTKYACAIPDGESVLLTGGLGDTMLRVYRYDANGYVAILRGNMKIGRWNHGCGAFLRQDGTKVFLVAGGYDASYTSLSSTELMVGDSEMWSITSPLPRAVWGLRGVTLGNTLYMSGGQDGSKQRDEILAWSDEKKGWEEVGKMKEGRAEHAITTINVQDVALVCG